MWESQCFPTKKITVDRMFDVVDHPQMGDLWHWVLPHWEYQWNYPLVMTNIAMENPPMFNR
jgi:hypothetical protein